MDTWELLMDLLGAKLKTVGQRVEPRWFRGTPGLAAYASGLTSIKWRNSIYAAFLSRCDEK